MARPTLEIDEQQVRALAQIGCTLDEMAVVLNCSVKTLQRRFDAVIKAGKLEAKVSLRRWQYQAAKKGSAAMLIWLGKQELGQRDKQQFTGADDGPIAIEHGLSEAELDKRIAGLSSAIARLESGAADTSEGLRIEGRVIEATLGEAET